MKRSITVVIFISLFVMFGLVSVAYAQDAPPVTPEPGRGMGRGMMGQGMGMRGNYAAAGQMHEYMQPALAKELGLTVEELQDRHDNGETFWQIAEDLGLTTEEALQLKLDARSAALDQMVADDLLTQEQADWMKNRGGNMMNGRGHGGCMGGSGSNPSGNGTGFRGGRWSRDG
jgi:hypothetical protein